MIVLICYDVAHDDDTGKRRLRRIARLCESHGARVQYSLFQCDIPEPTWVVFRDSLLSQADLDKDSLRFYFIDERAAARTEHHGVRAPLDLKGPLIV